MHSEGRLREGVGGEEEGGKDREPEVPEPRWLESRCCRTTSRRLEHAGRIQVSMVSIGWYTAKYIAIQYSMQYFGVVIAIYIYIYIYIYI